MTPKRRFVAANTFIYVDDDSLYRQQELAAAQDLTQMTTSERIATSMDIKYTDYQGGNIGVVSNSAGYGMATSDALALKGGKAANFSDFGGSAIHEQIDTLFYILDTDPKVRVIFINCYGGLMSIKKIAAVLIKALEGGIVTKPIVFRCLGQDHSEAREMLKGYTEKYNIHIENNFDDACQLAVDIAEQED